MGKVLRSRLRYLPVRNLNLESSIGVDEATGPLFYATFQFLIGRAQLFVRQRHLLLGPLPADLGVDACQSDREIYWLCDIVVGTKLQCIDNVAAFGIGRDHDYRKRGSRIPATNAFEG